MAAAARSPGAGVHIDGSERVPADNWLTNGGDVSNARYSTLNQINTGNVASLKEAWHIHLDGSGMAKKYSARGRRSSTTASCTSDGNDDVFALDATTGARLWTFHSNIDQNNNTVCCGWDSRGVALGDGKVFVAQLDGDLVALDQTTGNVVWKVQNVTLAGGHTMTMAPLYYNGLVYVGIVGRRVRRPRQRDRLRRDHGSPAWRFFTVPGPGDIGVGTWPSNTEWQTGGATVWNNPAVDPTTNTLVFTTANADAVDAAAAPGDNLFTSSFVAHRRDHRAVQVALPGRPPRPLGLRLPVADDDVRRHDRRRHPARRRRGVQDGLALRARP